ncbi:MAG TPA: hypothetical protein PLK41_08265 [Defluviitoga tunisiensis]|nr:hypothetical protein [Defluviitoga tunisiensis]
MGMKGLLIATTQQIINKLADIFDLMGDNETPQPDWETLQNQHKVISDQLNGLGGGYRTSEDIIPEEHSFERMYSILDGTEDFTFNSEGNFVFLKGNNAIVMNLSNYELTSFALNFGETVNQNYHYQMIERCGNNYVVYRRKYTYVSSKPFSTRLTENINRFYVFDQNFSYVSKFNWDTANYGGVKSICWDGTNLRVLTYVPSASGGSDPGISAYYDTLYACDLSGIYTGQPETMAAFHGGIIDPTKTIELKNYGLTHCDPRAHSQKFTYDGELFYFRKIFFGDKTFRIWAFNNTGQLSKIIKFNDMLGDIIYQNISGFNRQSEIMSLGYRDKYLYLLIKLMTNTFIAKMRIIE